MGLIPHADPLQENQTKPKAKPKPKKKPAPEKVLKTPENSALVFKNTSDKRLSQQTN